MGMFIRYIEEAKRTLVRAKHEADRFGSLEIDPEHILLALLNDPVLINRIMEGTFEKEIREAINTRLPRREPNRLPHDLPLSGAAREALHQALEQVPVEFREALVLRELEGLSYKEIATITGSPIGTVMSRLARGRDLLRRLLADHLPEEQ